MEHELQEKIMSNIKTFAEYQVEIRQLFDAEAAFNAAIEMCKEHYETAKEVEEDALIHESMKIHFESDTTHPIDLTEEDDDKKI